MDQAPIKRLKAAIARAAATPFAFYFRHFPVAAGKAALWKKVVVPYLLWHGFELRSRTPFGAVFHNRSSDLIQSYIHFFGVWEPTITEYLKRALKPGDVFIDVGANIGYFSLLASQLVGPYGRVYAIEASPETYRLLQRNLTENDTRNVESINVAVADQPGDLPFYRQEQHNIGQSTLVASVAALGKMRVEAVVKALPLPEVVGPDLAKAHLIKIDVEGAEWLVIQGMRAALRTLRPDVEILMELTPEMLATVGKTAEDVIAVFGEAGFLPYRIENRYQPEFYFRNQYAEPVRLTGKVRGQVDVIFRRGASGSGSSALSITSP